MRDELHRLKDSSRQITKAFALCCCVCLGLAGAEESSPAPAPELLSMLPIGLQQSTAAEVTVNGKHLDGVYEVWFDSPGLEGRIVKVQRDESPASVAPDKKDQGKDQAPRQTATLKLQLAANVRVGKHSLRLVGPAGVSNAVTFLVRADAATLETVSDHASPQSAQAIEVPLLLQGRLAAKGEVDYYSFEASAGEELVFHGTSNTSTKQGGFDALQFTLYEAGSSWFDPNRPTRLAFSDEPVMRYRFTNRGKYLLAVSGYIGIGGPDFGYQLRIHSKDESHSEQLQDSIIDKLRQPFSRNLDPDRVERLWERSIWVRPEVPANEAMDAKTAGVPGSPAISVSGIDIHAAAPKHVSNYIQELEPNDTAAGAQELSLPAMVDGSISKPGDADHFRFNAKAGDKFAFEIQTFASFIPEFNPRLAIFDSAGEEVFTNIWRRLGGDNGQWVKTLQSKTVFTIQKDGKYDLEIRDLVSYLYGDSTFRYRLLIRPQVPHIGTVELKNDRVNLVAGRAEMLSVSVDREEGYAGEVALSIENLPPGVEALPAAERDPDPLPKVDEGQKERFVPKLQKLAIVLIANADAPPTTKPHLVHVTARPVLRQQVGRSLPVRDIPVMVISPAAGSPNGGNELIPARSGK